MNSPKEKAEELVSKYFKFLGGRKGLEEWTWKGTYTWHQAKQCALISVEQVLEVLYENENMNTHQVNYWLDVRKELSNHE